MQEFSLLLLAFTSTCQWILSILSITHHKWILSILTINTPSVKNAKLSNQAEVWEASCKIDSVGFIIKRSFCKQIWKFAQLICEHPHGCFLCPSSIVHRYGCINPKYTNNKLIVEAKCSFVVKKKYFTGTHLIIDWNWPHAKLRYFLQSWLRLIFWYPSTHRCRQAWKRSCVLEYASGCFAFALNHLFPDQKR